VFGFRNWNVRFFPIERERLQTVKNCVQKSLNLFPHFLNLLINKKKKNSFGFFLNKVSLISTGNSLDNSIVVANLESVGQICIRKD